MCKNLKKAFLVLGSILLLGQSVSGMVQEEMFTDDHMYAGNFHGYNNYYLEQPRRYKPCVLSEVAQHCVAFAGQSSSRVAGLYRIFEDQFSKAAEGDFTALETEGKKTFLQIRKAIREERAEAVKSQIDSIRESSGKLNLVLGVTPKRDRKENVSKRFDSSWVFLGDGYEEVFFPGRELTADFNDVEDLEYLANIFEGRFDSIVMDASVYKFTKWGIAHMRQFERLLRPDGVFMFEPSVWGGGMAAPPMPDAFSLERVYPLSREIRERVLQMAKIYASDAPIHNEMDKFPGTLLKYFNSAFVSPRFPLTREELIAQWTQGEEGKSKDEFMYSGLLSAPVCEYYRLGFGAVSLTNDQPAVAQLKAYEYNHRHSLSSERDTTNVNSFAVLVETDSTIPFINEAFGDYNLWLDLNQSQIMEDVVRQYERQAVFPAMERRLQEIFGNARYDETVRYPFPTNYPQINGLFVCMKRS